MKAGTNFLLAAATLGAVVTNTTQAHAQMKGTNSVGAEVTIQDGTSFGINGKFGASEGFSIRPRVLFSATKKGTGQVAGITASGTEFGVAATFDFKPSSSIEGGKSPTIFLGPEVAFWNGNGRVGTTEFTVNSTIISVITGVEYPVNESVDLMAKLTLPLSSSATGSGGGQSRSGDLAKNVGFSFGAAFKF